MLLFASASPVVRNGCGIPVEPHLSPWAAPLSSECLGIISAGNPRLSICRKGAAQAKNELNGKAQPFLTTDGKAISKRKAF